MITRGPILKIENFISPLFCEDIIDRSNNNIFNVDKNNDPTKTNIYNELTEIRYSPYIDTLIEDCVDEYYNTEIEYISKNTLEWFPTGSKNQSYSIDGYHYLNQKWINTSDVDFVSLCFLNNYCNKPNFDHNSEVYCDGITFLNFNVTIKPSCGMLLFFPAHPSFTYKINDVTAGNLFILKNTLTSIKKYTYNQESFAGTPAEWKNKLIG